MQENASLTGADTFLGAVRTTISRVLDHQRRVAAADRWSPYGGFHAFDDGAVWYMQADLRQYMNELLIKTGGVASAGFPVANCKIYQVHTVSIGCRGAGRFCKPSSRCEVLNANRKVAKQWMRQVDLGDTSIC